MHPAGPEVDGAISARKQMKELCVLVTNFHIYYQIILIILSALARYLRDRDFLKFNLESRIIHKSSYIISKKTCVPIFARAKIH